MQTYFVTFEPDADDNSPISVEIRGLLEELAPRSWYQVFPFQVALKTGLSVSAIEEKVMAAAKGKRFSVVQASEWAFHDRGRDQEMRTLGL